MSKDELEYEKMLKQMEELQKKLSDKKKVLDKERDDAIIDAIHEIDITREQGYELARIIKYKGNIEAILKLTPKEEPVTKRGRKPKAVTTTESEETVYEE